MITLDLSNPIQAGENLCPSCDRVVVVPPEEVECFRKYAKCYACWEREEEIG